MTSCVTLSSSCSRLVDCRLGLVVAVDACSCLATTPRCCCSGPAMSASTTPYVPTKPYPRTAGTGQSPQNLLNPANPLHAFLLCPPGTLDMHAAQKAVMLIIKKSSIGIPCKEGQYKVVEQAQTCSTAARLSGSSVAVATRNSGWSHLLRESGSSKRRHRSSSTAS